jgi:hypothetical protein
VEGDGALPKLGIVFVNGNSCLKHQMLHKLVFNEFDVR